jgi:hypothetical protein
VKKYHKIHTVFKRGPRKELLEGQFSLPEFEYLQNSFWVWTEKINGTNIRIQWRGSIKTVVFLGKTDNARIPPPLLDALRETFTIEALTTVCGKSNVCLYGEGYGPSIGKGGKNFRGQHHSFMLFDVLIDTWWLQRPSLEDISSKLDISLAPQLGSGTITNMVEMCRIGFESTLGPFQAEGVVAQPRIQLFSRKGERIITKLKCADFRKRG